MCLLYHYFYPLVFTLSLLDLGVSEINFSEYLIKFNKTYPNTTEYGQRKSNYDTRVTDFPNINSSFTPGINNFTDWSVQEFQRILNQQPLPEKRRVYFTEPSTATDAAVIDWRTYNGVNAVTSVKSQSLCGSSWAHASTALAESYAIIYRGQPNTIDFSENYLFQCMPNVSCTVGGNVWDALHYLSVRAPTQNSFNRFNSCQADGVLIQARRKVYYNITDAQLISLLQKGPVVALISGSTLTSYSSGIIKCNPEIVVSHAVLVIGFTNSAYIIKNSWGTSWGSSGIGQISREALLNCNILRQVYVLSQQLTKLIYLSLLIIVALVLS